LATRRAACKFVQQGPHGLGLVAQPIEIGIGGGVLLDQGHQAHELLVVAHLQIVTKAAAQVVGARKPPTTSTANTAAAAISRDNWWAIFRRGMGSV
jgi:hypothetical protein